MLSTARSWTVIVALLVGLQVTVAVATQGPATQDHTVAGISLG